MPRGAYGLVESTGVMALGIRLGKLLTWGNLVMICFIDARKNSLRTRIVTHWGSGVVSFGKPTLGGSAASPRRR